MLQRNKIPYVGKPEIKSIVIVCQTPDGIGRGDNSPGYATLSGLACWKIKQEAHLSLMKDFIAFHLNK